MATWTCPECGRTFGRARQGHMCNPGMTLEEYFAQAKPWEQPIFEAIHDHVSSLDGELIVDPIAIGIQLKNGPVFCILRSMKKWVAVGFNLRRPLTSNRLSRKTVDYGDKYFHVVNVADPSAIDDEFKEWLTEAFFHHAGAPSSSGGDPMVPDDVDLDW